MPRFPQQEKRRPRAQIAHRRHPNPPLSSLRQPEPGRWRGCTTVIYIMGTGPFRDLKIPAELQASLERHLEHQELLATSLRSAGIAEAQIERSVSVLSESYKEQLIQAMERLENVG